jgi:hypothetical protein
MLSVLFPNLRSASSDCDFEGQQPDPICWRHSCTPVTMPRCSAFRAKLRLMPFTLSHAAAVIPFRRTPFVMSALVMGCFVPDFPYLISLSPRMFYGHTFPGMFVLDLPLALLALWLFHAFVKQPMLMFLSVGFRRRLRTSVNSFPFWPWERLSLIILSILIGTATHLLWDAFTHPTRIYENWAFLRINVELPAIGEMPMYKLLEYVSSVFGLVVVAVWIWHWYRTTNPSAYPAAQAGDAAQRHTFVAVLPTLAILGGILRAYRAHGIHPEIRLLMYFTADILISAITFFLLGLLSYGVILRWQKPRCVRE